MIICLTLLCGYAKAQTRGGDSSPPLPKEISAELFDKAVELIKEFEGCHSAKHYPYIGYGHKLLPHENLTADIMKHRPIRYSEPTYWNDTSISDSMGKMLCC